MRRALKRSIDPSALLLVLKIYLQPTILEVSEAGTKDQVLFFASASSSCAMTTLQCGILEV
jgi:hypothetical protein